MPAIKLLNQATQGNAATGLQFNSIGPNGAYVSMFASGVTAGDTIGLTVGTKPILDLAQPNIEISADVCDTQRDLLIEREPVPPGDIFIPIVATTAVNFLLIIEEAAPGELTVV